jgi:hypothetical protein
MLLAAQIVLPAKKFETTKCLSTFFLAKRRQKAETIVITFELFIYGDIHYITNSFCKTALRDSDTLANFFLSLSVYFYLHLMYRHTGKIMHIFIVYLFILHSVL